MLFGRSSSSIDTLFARDVLSGIQASKIVQEAHDNRGTSVHIFDLRRCGLHLRMGCRSVGCNKWVRWRSCVSISVRTVVVGKPIQDATMLQDLRKLRVNKCVSLSTRWRLTSEITCCRAFARSASAGVGAGGRVSTVAGTSGVVRAKPLNCGG